MPTGGLVVFGSGIRLQPNSPGVTDVGNEHISGRLIAEGGVQTDPTHIAGNQGQENFGHGNSMSSTPAVVLGIYNSTLIGANNYAAGLGSQAGGSQAAANGVSCYAGFDGGSQNAAYGSFCNANGSSGDGGIAVAFGSGVTARGNSHAMGGRTVSCIVVGGNPCAAWGQGINITQPGACAFGSNISITAPNVTALGDRTGLPALNTANTLALGRPDQTRVLLGAFVFSGGSVSAYFRQSVDVSVVNTTVETTLIGASTGSMTIATGDFSVGKAVRIKAAGYLSAGTGSPTLQIRIKDDGGNVFFDSGAFAIPGAPTNAYWELELVLTVRSLGNPGTIKGQGRVLWGATNVSPLIEFTPMTAAASINTTSDRTINLTAQWGTASSSNTITCDTLTMEALG